MGSPYLLKPLRTLQGACCNIRAAHPELIIWDCDSCLHAELCAISEQIERDRLGHLTNENQAVPQASKATRRR